MNILFIIKVNIKWWYRSPCPFLPHNQHARSVAMMLNILWTRAPISFEHTSIWFELLYPRLTTHHSEMVVRLGQVTMKGLLPLHKVCDLITCTSNSTYICLMLNETTNRLMWSTIVKSWEFVVASIENGVEMQRI